METNSDLVPQISNPNGQPLLFQTLNVNVTGLPKNHRSGRFSSFFFDMVTLFLTRKICGCLYHTESAEPLIL